MQPKDKGERLMKRRRSATGVFWLLLIGLMFTPVLAQQPASPPADAAKAQVLADLQLTRAAIGAERQALITRAMDLSVEEMQDFWPLYREYRLEAAALGDRLVALILTYAENYQNLTDEVADQLLTETIRVEQDRARLKAKYLPKFKQVMPARKVARFYQLENKLDLAILAELAQEIPLAR